MEDFLSRVQPDGTVKQHADEMITLQITVTAEQEALIHRLTEVLSARGHVPTTAEAIMSAVDKLLDQRDQLRRATKMATKDAERAGEVRDDQVMMDEGVAEKLTAAKQLHEDHIVASYETLAEMSIAQDSPGEEQSLLPQSSQTRELGHSIRKRIPEAVKRAVFRRSEGR